ncbi:MAG: GTPase ObgE [Chloroflexales bacterium]|nr:GTPase ObgE [Chloroflexales bacterium]
MAGELYDQATIFIKSGSGGNGAATFRREKYIPRGGPDGGDGGRGGNVYLVADARINTLLSFRYKRKFSAGNGGHGKKQTMRGKQGQDLEITVPPGTVISAEIDNETYTIDLERPGQRLLAARGGKGGLGNVHFATSTYQVPRIAELGEPGEELTLQLELKLIADVGLVGFPNAGKSTLLSVISAARPKIAPYPFTTLQPNLGIVEVGYDRFVVADIPGLIEGAHQGVGLGFDFLRHVERTRLLLHIVDAAGVDGRDPLEDYHQINAELRQYQPELAGRPQIVVLNKIDLPEAQANVERLRRELPVSQDNLFVIAAATREGIEPLLQHVAQNLRDMPTLLREPVEPDEPPLTWPIPEVDPNIFVIEREGEGWRVHGRRIERLITMTNFAQPDSLDRIARVMAASGIANALMEMGVQEGDSVYIAKEELTWSDTDLYG